MGKRIISALLALVMVVGMLPVTALAAGTEVASGTCGENLTWALDSEGTLMISGMGEMENYDEGQYAPWFDYRAQIISVVIENNVSTIGAYAFIDCSRLNEIKIPDSITTIGRFAFIYCINLVSVRIPERVESIGEMAFA